MLMDLLSNAATVATLSFVVSSMLAMGAGLTTAQIVEPLRNVRLVALALLANFVLMPLGAIALVKVLWLDEPFGIGLLLLGCAAGAPFLPKLAELAKGNLAFAVGAMVVLMVVTVGYLPIVLPLLLRGITVDTWNIARSLGLLMLLPLAVGLVLKARYEDLATRVKPWLDWISNVSLILVILLITAANLDKVLQVFGTRGILAGLLLIAVGFGIGWLLGGPATTRDVSWCLVLDSATLPPHSSSRPKASATQKWLSWSSLSRSSD
jgi:BASS family bile acid:Na+ symporter